MIYSTKQANRQVVEHSIRNSMIADQSIDTGKGSRILVLLSPTKTMKSSASSIGPDLAMSTPVFFKKSLELISYLQAMSMEDLTKVLQVNEKLAKQNHERLSSYHRTMPSYAIYCYQGLQYKALDIDSLRHRLSFINDHFRILSGLYGVLKPLDGIVPYRLDLKSKIDMNTFNNLYQYWNSLCYEEVTQDARTIINLASQEYSSLIEPFIRYTDHYIEIRFLVEKHGIRKQESTAAKIARGLMARWIIELDVTEADQLKKFDLNGYCFDETASTNNMLVFVRVVN